MSTPPKDEDKGEIKPEGKERDQKGIAQTDHEIKTNDEKSLQESENVPKTEKNTTSKTLEDEKGGNSEITENITVEAQIRVEEEVTPEVQTHVEEEEKTPTEQEKKTEEVDEEIIEDNEETIPTREEKKTLEGEQGMKRDAEKEMKTDESTEVDGDNQVQIDGGASIETELQDISGKKEKTMRITRQERSDLKKILLSIVFIVPLNFIMSMIQLYLFATKKGKSYLPLYKDLNDLVVGYIRIGDYSYAVISTAFFAIYMLVAYFDARKRS